jgi:hypothetical protein
MLEELHKEVGQEYSDFDLIKSEYSLLLRICTIFVGFALAACAIISQLATKHILL